MSIIDDLWHGNYEPSLYEPTKREKELINLLDIATQVIQARYKDDKQLESMIELYESLLIETQTAAFRQGIQFGAQISKEI